MKINIFLCEGPHDVAFLYKLFRYIEYKDIANSKIVDLPEPFNKYFEILLKNHKYENENLFGRPLLPTLLQSDSEYILLYGVGGITKVPECKSIITDFTALINSEKMNPNKYISCSIAFIIDADKVGVSSREKNLREKYDTVFSDISNLKHNNHITDDNFDKVGLYIFSNTDGYGKLEDIILPLMKIKNEKIFDDAETYYDNNFDKNRIKKKNETKVDKQKSQIGIAGQLQFSGIANNSIIKQTDYIDHKKIASDANCLNIINFLNMQISTSAF